MCWPLHAGHYSPKSALSLAAHVAACTKAIVAFYGVGMVFWRISGNPFGHKDDNEPTAAQKALRGN